MNVVRVSVSVKLAARLRLIILKCRQNCTGVKSTSAWIWPIDGHGSELGAKLSFVKMLIWTYKIENVKSFENVGTDMRSYGRAFPFYTAAGFWVRIVMVQAYTDSLPWLM